MNIQTLAMTSIFFATSAQAETDLTPYMNTAAEDLGFQLSGIGDGTAICLPDEQLDYGECDKAAARINEPIHQGDWYWAPRGCHFSTQHRGVWFNNKGTGPVDNTNNTPVCKSSE